MGLLHSARLDWGNVPGGAVWAVILGGLAVGSPAIAADTAAVPAFLQLNAVQPRGEDGFLAVGPLQTGDDPNRLDSAFIALGRDGTPVGDPAPLPLPSGYSYGNIVGLVVLPGGEFIGVGSVKRSDPEQDAWLIRFSADGHVAWNLAVEGARDERLYSVKRLANGDLIAVGRSQVSPAPDQQSDGLAVWFDETGKVGQTLFFNQQCELRCGFQDVAETPQGLVFVGWATTDTRKDDVWVVPTDARGKQLAAVQPSGSPGNDIAWSAWGSFGRVAMAGMNRGDNNHPFGFLARPQNPVSIPAMGGELRAVQSMPGGDILVVAGGSVPSSGDPKGYVALVDADGVPSQEAEHLPSGYSYALYLAVAVNSTGQIVLVGKAAVDRSAGPFHGLVGRMQGGALCNAAAPAQASTRSLSAGEETTACAGPGPLEFRLPAVASATGIIVRPIAGAVDVLLNRNGHVIDASLNSGLSAEFVELPADGGDLMLTISPEADTAMFRIARVALVEAHESTPLAPEILPLLELGFRRLGFDSESLMSPGGSAGALHANAAIKRAIRTFQAEAGHPVTGIIGPNQYQEIFSSAAEAMEPIAIEAAADAREFAASRPEVNFTDQEVSSNLKSFRGGLRLGRVYGVGIFQSGASFEAYGTRKDRSSIPPPLRKTACS